jgi:hypothetical protein
MASVDEEWALMEVEYPSLHAVIPRQIILVPK